MKRYKVDFKLNRTRAETWKLITDVENFPKYILHLYNVKLAEPIKQGSTWSDWTTLLWIPLRFNHVNIQVVPEKVFEYQFSLPFNGSVTQKFEITGGDNPTSVSFYLTLDLKPRLVEILILPILAKRWEGVMKTAVERLEKENNGTNS